MLHPAVNGHLTTLIRFINVFRYPFLRLTGPIFRLIIANRTPIASSLPQASTQPIQFRSWLVGADYYSHIADRRSHVEVSQDAVPRP